MLMLFGAALSWRRARALGLRSVFDEGRGMGEGEGGSVVVVVEGKKHAD